MFQSELGSHHNSPPRRGSHSSSENPKELWYEPSPPALEKLLLDLGEDLTEELGDPVNLFDALAHEQNTQDTKNTSQKYGVNSLCYINADAFPALASSDRA